MSPAESNRHTLLSFLWTSEIVIAAHDVAMTYCLKMKTCLLFPIQSPVTAKSLNQKSGVMKRRREDSDLIELLEPNVKALCNTY